MQNSAILVVDMLRGFLEEGYPLYCGKEAREIITPVQKRLEGFNYFNTFYLCDSHAPDDAEFKIFPPHCIKGTVESEVIPELSSYSGTIIPKIRYSGFYATDLEKILFGLGSVEKVYLVGVCTDICILYTAADLRNRNYNVAVYKDSVASFNQNNHEHALTHMKNILGLEII